MISSLRSIRLTRRQLIGVSAFSVLATGLIIATALGRTGAQTAVLAALRQRPTEVRLGSPAPASRPVSTSSSEPAATSVASSPVTPASSAGGGSAASTAGNTGSSGSASGGSGTAAPTTTATTSTTTTDSSTTSAAAKYNIKHVFVIALSTTSFEAAFGQGSVAHYLNGTLRREGTLLGGYESLGLSELPDFLAMVSGQAPNPDTTGDCATYTEFPSGAKPATNGQVPGDGCIYPNTIITIGDQATGAGETWRAYIEDIGSSTCPHPNSNAVDDAPLPGTGPDYDTRHNPFIYFHSLLDLGGCAKNDVNLTQLPGDLRSASKTPAYAFIAPGACEDALAKTCPDGRPGGLAAEDAFLKQWVPRILASAAYKSDGVLIIAFALAGTGAAGGPAPTGALVLSRYATAGKTISTTYNAYSVLRSTEDLLGYTPLVRASSAQSFVTSALSGAPS